MDSFKRRNLCKEDLREEAKQHDDNAVGVYNSNSDLLVGHVPIEISRIIFYFLKAHADTKVKAKV